MTKQEQYFEFLKSKVCVAPETGLLNFILHDYPFHDGTVLKPHQKDAIEWAIRGGRRALFESFGLGKTIQQLIVCKTILEVEGGKALIICPLGVRQEFFKDANRKLGINLTYVRNQTECENAPENSICITNYERVRDGNIDPKYFVVTSLDEASVLRSYGSKTYQTFLEKFKGIKYKFVCTATPSPNKHKELIHYAGYLEVMDTGQALTRFFKRDSTKANNLKIHPHKEREFFLWLSTWALFITKPSDLGYDDTGYDLPGMKVIYHKVNVDHSTAGFDDDGQAKMFRDSALGLKDAAREKRDTCDIRVEKMMEILTNDPESHYILWHDQERERHAIKKVLPHVKAVFGNEDMEVREQLVLDFAEGRSKYLPTKPSLSGQGCNLQHFCHKAIFLGIGYEFNDFIQAIHRIHRFLQSFEVEIHVIYAESEEEILKTLQRKWTQHDVLVNQMTGIIKEYGLSNTNINDKLKRSIMTTRSEIKGKLFTAVHSDTVPETMNMPDNSVHLGITSIPFANHYEYTPDYNDFGHTDTNAHFWEQMDFLTPELHRVLMPGRLFCVHVKDRVLFGNTTGDGFPTLDGMLEETLFHFKKHGFKKVAIITIETDVVRENNQTYRLGWTEKCKDGSKMGVGCPEYVLVFRKHPTDTSRAYSDVPVVKSKGHFKGYKCISCSAFFKNLNGVKKTDEEFTPHKCPKCGEHTEMVELWDHNTKNIYTRGQWQIDARAKWNSSGDRFLTPEELKQIPIDRVNKYFTEWMKDRIYNYDQHVETAKMLDEIGKLPATFQTLNIPARNMFVWDDINRMLTLNGSQTKKKLNMHICPLQFDIVDRCINEYSNPGETIFDPFAGLFTVPFRAIKMGRIGIGNELNPESFRDGVSYLRSAEQNALSPSFFDLMDIETLTA